ncbi:MAG: hypothetical protein ACRCZB_09610 [Bacteroidales bacterium]
MLANAPFFAENKEGENTQFLGEGYYFWDNNLEMAQIWGDSHYKEPYFIVECEIDISPEKCFDLVGNREHQILLSNLLLRLRNRNHDKQNWTVADCLDFLKTLDSKDTFPYQSIRATDYVVPETLEQDKCFFVKKYNHYTILHPKMAICVFDKSTLPSEKKIIFKS